MTTRAKFSCVEITPTSDTFKIRLTPVYSGSEENRDFFKWTPGGEIVLQVVGGQVTQQFKVGHDYYVDFTEVSE